MAEIIDAHLHCSLHGTDKEMRLRQLKMEMDKFGIKKAILYFIDDNDFDEKNYAHNLDKHIIPGMMLHPNDNSADAKLKELKRHNIRLIKLLPYEQKLLYQDYDTVCKFTKMVQEHGMALTICAAYGSKYIYATNGVELAERVLRNGFEGPLIIAHGGMVRVLDVLALMQEYQNLYIDISFTIPFWWESHVIQDLYFVMKHLNYKRIFWGSDYPNYSLEEALSKFYLFCKKYNISAADQAQLLSGNFNSFYQKYWEN
ncbi:hypothetical protein D3Z36_16325 [Lachnospiraceae bacterium]|nr:hypothetical protein [Lachnospiraceae bacterium]